MWKPSIFLATSSTLWFGVVCQILMVPSSDPEAYDSPVGENLTQCTGPWCPLLHPTKHGRNQSETKSYFCLSMCHLHEDGTIQNLRGAVALSFKRAMLFKTILLTNLLIWTCKMFWESLTNLLAGVEIKHSDPHILTASYKLFTRLGLQRCRLNIAWHVITLH